MFEYFSQPPTDLLLIGDLTCTLLAVKKPCLF